MLRVDTRRVQGGVLEFLISGTLDGERIGVLQQALDGASAHGHAVSLNLGGVVSVDRAGMDALLEWNGHGARLIDCPSFLRRWIHDERLSRIRDES